MRHFPLYCLYIVIWFQESEQNIIAINRELVSADQEDAFYRKCLENLLGYYWDADGELMVTNVNSVIFQRKPIRLVDLSEKHLITIQEKLVIYLFDISSNREKANFQRHLEGRYFHFTSRAKFVFIISFFDVNKTKAFLNTLTEHYIYRVLILDKNSIIYTFFPYKYENINDPYIEPWKIGKCTKIRASHIKSYLNASNCPKFWRNSTINLHFKPMPPYVNTKFTGSEQRLMGILANYLGFHVNATLGSNEFQGVARNGTFHNVGLHLLNRKVVQAVAGGFRADAELRMIFDSGSICYIGSVNIFTPKAVILSAWHRMFKIFSTPAKLGLIGTTLIWIIFVKTFYKEKTSTLIFMAFMICCQIPVTKLSSYRYRLPLAFWIMGFFIISTTIISMLQEIFFSNAFEQEIDSVEDVLKTNLLILVPVDIAQSFTQKEDKLIAKRMIPCVTDISSCLVKVCFDRAAVMLGSKITVMIEALKVCFDYETGMGAYHIGEAVNNFYLQIYYSKGYPAVDAFNDATMRAIYNSGVASKEVRDNMERYEKALAKITTKSKLSSKALKMRHLILVFLLWIIGIVSSIVVFLFEMCLKLV